MASTTPALDVQAFMSDPRWPAYNQYLRARLEVLQHRLDREVPLEYPAMCRTLGEIRGIKFALGTPVELATSDPRSENA